ncbi:M20/M25/M40 family metallo-hydrolase [Pedobacter chitinilyticus]|uniref:M20/M25/M40 family metallo-hydrolase n=1 Tax=Pedobacter chitinilyticus TaxID=2233776 RepID=A0A3S3QFE7_9SPHI|nr:M20/M25/M40 family metallo-hydrolase [Pedobacter chitinilyticus]RWU07387.1 M20/M25/M40 family metallo-hydrolase [Pedobacter chitinilyticus]
MKKTFYALGLALASLTANAQNIDKIITKDYVDHLIKTLSSDDMQGRRTFTPGIDKAASFIEKEFAAIGLKPLDGEKGYRQTFYKYQLKPLSAKVTIDGQAIAEENILVYGNRVESVSFDQTNGDGWIKLDESKDFMSQFRTLARSGKRQLVLVDMKFLDAFKRVKGMIGRETVVDEADLKNAKSPATVFVLDKESASSFQVELKNTVSKMPLFNVAGMIPGKSKAKELVVFSGHYDHMGIVKPVEGDSIMNGADDDASGTSAVVALAKYYKKLNKNERTLIFVAFTAEEIGGYGSRYFSEKLNPDDVVAMFNIEMIGKDSKFGKNTAFITGYDKSDFGKILQKNLEGTEFTFHPDPYKDQNLFYRSDNATLAALGVPAHTISTDQIDIDKLYHTVKDEYSSLDVENILSTIKAIAKSAVSIISGADTPTRIPKLKQ